MHLADIYTACVLVVLDFFEVHVRRDVAVAREGDVGVDDHEVEVFCDVKGVLGIVSSIFLRLAWDYLVHRII